MIAVASLLRAPFLKKHRAPNEAELDGGILFELAYLAAASDGTVGVEELRSLALVGAALGLTDLDKRVRALGEGLHATPTFEERVTEVARKFTTRASRRAAYSLVFVIHVSDLNQAPAEDELEILLEKEWGFEAEAAELKDEVMTFLNGE